MEGAARQGRLWSYPVSSSTETTFVLHTDEVTDVLPVRRVRAWAAATGLTMWQLSKSQTREIRGHKPSSVCHPFKGAKCLYIWGDLVPISFDNSKPSLHEEIVHIPLAQQDKKRISLWTLNKAIVVMVKGMQNDRKNYLHSIKPLTRTLGF